MAPQSSYGAGGDWCGREDSNLCRPVEIAQVDSDKPPRGPGATGVKAGGDSDRPGSRPRHGHAGNPDHKEHDPAPKITVGDDDPLLARLRAAHGGGR